MIDGLRSISGRTIKQRISYATREDDRGALGMFEIMRPSDVVRDIRNLNGRSKPLERALLFLSVDSFRSLLPYGK